VVAPPQRRLKICASSPEKNSAHEGSIANNYFVKFI
jgi:hypothetical protein